MVLTFERVREFEGLRTLMCTVGGQSTSIQVLLFAGVPRFGFSWEATDELMA